MQPNKEIPKKNITGPILHNKAFPLHAQLWPRGWVEPREGHGTHCTGGRVGLRAGLENLAPPGFDPAHRESLY